MVWNFKRKGYWPILHPRSKCERRELQTYVNSTCLLTFSVDKSRLHFSREWCAYSLLSRVRMYLDNKRPGNWIGRGGLLEWPPRSPYLTPCHFFLWGHLKERVFTTTASSIEDLKSKIKRECRRIRPSVLRKVWDNVKLR